MKKILISIVVSLLSSVAMGQKLPNLPGSLGADIGFFSFAGADGAFETRPLDSRGFSLYYKYDMTMGGNPKWVFNPGIAISWEGYSMEEEIEFSRLDDRVFIHDFSGNDHQKTKFAATYLDIPLEFQYRTNPSREAFRASLGGKIGYLLRSHVKYKYENPNGDTQRDKRQTNYGLTNFRYGLTARVGYGRINLFAYYALNPFFESDQALIDDRNGVELENDFNTFTLGFTINAL